MSVVTLFLVALLLVGSIGCLWSGFSKRAQRAFWRQPDAYLGIGGMFSCASQAAKAYGSPSLGLSLLGLGVVAVMAALYHLPGASRDGRA